MNHKKVFRLMNKYSLQSEIRRKDPYAIIRAAQQESSIAPNLLGREFRSIVPYRKLGTDITYLLFRGRWVYLSIVKDMISGEVLAWHVSMHPDLILVQETLRKLEMNVPGKELIQALLHSDQGFQYTHQSFSLKLKEIGCIQSMSRKGNCLDNAPTESFFGHLKDELDIRYCTTFEELRISVDAYMHYYNNDRPQWARKKMTPVEYRNHLLKISGNL